MAKLNRGKLDDTLAAMFSNPDYRSDYLFYAHVIGQCSIKMDKHLPAAAGIAFVHDHYNLYINPDQFDILTLKERLAVLKHEMLHILWGHVQRKEDRVHLPWNYATDCALNQHIDRSHLPDWVIYPDGLSKMLGGVSVKENESSEFYYELMKENAPDECPNCGGTGVEPDDQQGEDESDQGDQGDKGDQGDQEGDGSGDGDSDKEGSGEGDQEGEDSDSMGKPKEHKHGGTKPCSCCGGKGHGKPGEGKPQPGTHSTWEESRGNKELQKDITKKMTEKAQTETIKSAGTVPNACSDWLELHSRKSEVNWKRVLRGIVGNKKVGYRTTIHRRDRRFPKREDLRGKTKNRMFNLLVVADVSGSMSDQAVLTTLAEVRHICDVTSTPVDLIQIDTEAYEPEKLTKQTKLISRKGCGGTILHSALHKAKERGIDFQAVVVLTDGHLFGDDISCFKDTKKKIIWLIEPNGVIDPEMLEGRMKAFKMKGAEE